MIRRPISLASALRRRAHRKHRENRRQLLVEFLEDRRMLTTYTWIGAGADGNWNTGGNWQGDSAPAGSGHTLVFNTDNLGIGARYATNNNISDLTDITIQIEDSDSEPGADFSLSGISVGLSVEGLTNTTGATTDLTTISLPLSGTGGITSSGAGTLTISGTGSTNNTASGSLQVDGGTLVLGGGFAGDGGWKGNVTINNSGTLRLAQSNILANASLVTVNSGGTLNTAGFGDAIGALAGAGSIQGGNTLTLDMVNGTQPTFSGTITNTSLNARGENDNGSGSKQILTGTWSGGQLSVSRGNSANDVVLIELAGGGTTNVASVSVGQSGSGTATLSIKDTHALSSTGTFYVGEASGHAGNVNQSGGTVTVSGQMRLGHWSNQTSSYDLSDGTLNANGGLYIGWDGTGNMSLSGSGALNATVGTYVQKSSTLTIGETSSFTANYLSIGDSRGAGTVVQNGGTVLVGGEVRVGHYSTTGSYTINGGNLTVNGTGSGAESSGVITIGVDGTGVLNHHGGTITTRGLYLDSRGATTGIDQYNLTGGTLVLTSALGIAGNATASTFQVNLGGGTVQSNAAWSSSVPMTLTGTGGDVRFDTIGNNTSLTGIISGNGGITKLGNGLLIVTGENAYLGGTTVSGGTLRITSDRALGAIPNSPTINVTLRNGGRIMGGSASAGANVTLDPNRSIELPDGDGYFHIWTGYTMNVPGAISGSGTLRKSDGGVLNY